MARSTTMPPPPPDDFVERIIDIDVEQEMQGAFLEYAYSVIYSRALPDARDGLKPVQRRILYSMQDMGLRPDRGHVKCARIVGEVMGKLHPHGDTAIYDALARMAQSWSMRVPLVDGHGNFGSLDDPPAAYRYCVTGDTRIRLADGSSPRIQDLAALSPNSERSLDVEVLDRDGKPVLADKIFHSGIHPTFELTTVSGNRIRGTANHPVLVLAEVGGVPRIVWRRLDEIEEGDVVCLARNAVISAVPEPDEWNLGVLCGAWVSEGWASVKRAGFNNTDKTFFDHVVRAYDELVGGRRYTSSRLTRRSGRRIYELDIQNMGAFITGPLADLVGKRSAAKDVPEVIWRSKPGAKRAFLMSVFEGDGGVKLMPGKAIAIHYSTHSQKLALELQEMLLEFGVHAQLGFYAYRGEYKLIISGRHNVWAYADNIGFVAGKQTQLRRLLADLPRDTHRLSRDFAPYITKFALGRMGPERGSGRTWLKMHNIDRRERWLLDRSLILHRLKDLEVRSVVAAIMDSGYRFVEVASVDAREPAAVYSVRVASEDHSFLAGGFVNHNTEARLDSAAMLMVAGLDEDTVDFIPSYDNQSTQPEVLPSAFPNLLVNGSSGIAVGMATNMAPHNLIEVIAAARHLLRHPNATLDDLMRFVPGPDLPSGGRVIGLDGIRDAYATGRGTFRTRAKVSVEPITARRQGLIVTELPYLVGPEKVIDKITDLVQAKRLQGIADVTELSDRTKGMRLVIELKGGFNPDAVLEQLYRLTPMEETFGINNVALVEGQPRTLGLKELLEVYVKHQLNVVTRRTTFRRQKRLDRLHLVAGMLIAIVDIDEVIQIVRTSDDTAQARDRLITVFDLTTIQADYILEMPLRRLTRFSAIELERERDQLQSEIDELSELLADDAKLRTVVSDELAEVAKRFGTPRRTVLLEGSTARPAASAATPLEVADDPCRVLLSSTGRLARTAAGPDGDPDPDPSGRRQAHDVIVSTVQTTARGEVAAITSLGRMIRLPVLDMPALPPTSGPPALSGGAPVKEFLALGKNERLLALCSLDTDGPGIAVGTAKGVVKRVTPEYPANKDDWEIIALRDGDEVVGAVELRDAARADLVFVTSDAQLLRFGAEVVRPQGRAAGGVAGINLAARQRVVYFGAVDLRVKDGEWGNVVVTVSGSSSALPGTQTGSAKVTPFAEFPAKGRATGGVRCHRFLKNEDVLLLAWAGAAPPQAATSSGAAVTLPEQDPRRDGSGLPLPKAIQAISSGPRV